MNDIVLIQDSKCIASRKSTANGFHIASFSKTIQKNILRYVIYNSQEQGHFHLLNTLNHSFYPHCCPDFYAIWGSTPWPLTQRAQYQLKPKSSTR